MAVTEEIAVSKKSKVEAFALCAMVMSAPMVEYGQAVWMSSDIVGSGSKDISKGCAEISLVFVFFFRSPIECLTVGILQWIVLVAELLRMSL